MRQRTGRSIGNQVSLFPFLAVLVCTMGALLVLLVVMAQQAKLQAASVEAPKAIPAPMPALPTTSVTAEDLAKADQQIRQRMQQVVAALAKAKDNLSQRNLELAHLEGDMRRWQDRLAELRREYARLKDVGQSTDEQQRKMREELARLKEDISLAAQLLVDEQKRLVNRPKSYALVPYDGASGTYRRPLYIECTEDKVTLQPLGIELTESDFDGPLGPGNPLAAALRAMRQHLTKNSPNAGQQQAEPYPLIVVRPDGITEYYTARKAIKSWGAGFGYEFIEQDRNLDWGQPDPEMAKAVQAAIAQARVQQRVLMRAAPKRYRNNPFSAAGVGRGGSVGDRVGDGPSGGGGSSRHGDPGSGGPLASGSGSGAARGSGGEDDPSGGRYDPKQGLGNDQQGSARADQTRPGAQGGTPGGVAGGSAIEGGTVRSVASKRGRNWALPQRRRGAIGYSRPISMRLEADRIVFPNREGADRVIPLGPRTKDSIDKVVAVVWKQMESWGSAGNGAYWKPVLKCEVAPDAKSRYAALNILLLDSGIDIGIGGR